MSASRTRDHTPIPWWGYLGWIDDDSLGWTYDLYGLYGREAWPDEFDDSVKEGSFNHRAPEDEADPAPPAPFGRGLLARAMHAIASCFRSAMAERRARAEHAESNLALPRSRI